MFDEAGIQRRLPVWHAFADLFLDTETQPEDYERLARILRTAPFGREELRQILVDKVAPAFLFNLLDVAGEWAGWNEDDVRKIMLASLSSRWRAPLSWLTRRESRRIALEEWSRIEGYLPPT